MTHSADTDWFAVLKLPLQLAIHVASQQPRCSMAVDLSLTFGNQGNRAGVIRGVRGLCLLVSLIALPEQLTARAVTLFSGTNYERSGKHEGAIVI